MKTFDLLHIAQNAASEYFQQEFSHSGNVGIEKKEEQPDGTILYEFYSKDDPAMDDTFVCLVTSGEKKFYVTRYSGKDYSDGIGQEIAPETFFSLKSHLTAKGGEKYQYVLHKGLVEDYEFVDEFYSDEQDAF